jgi:hypothetical protein
MEVPVLLERREHGFRAKAWDVTAEGDSREEALERLGLLLNTHEITSLEISAPKRNWRHVTGIFKDDPTFDEFLAIIEENRRIENETEGIYPERNPEPEQKK